MSKNEDFGWERRETILRSLKNESRYLSHAILAFWKQRIDPWLYKDRSLYFKTRSLVQQGLIIELKVDIFSSFSFGFFTPISRVNYATNNHEKWLCIWHLCSIGIKYWWTMMQMILPLMQRCMLMIFIFILFILGKVKLWPL